MDPFTFGEGLPWALNIRGVDPRGEGHGRLTNSVASRRDSEALGRLACVSLVKHFPIKFSNTWPARLPTFENFFDGLDRKAQFSSSNPQKTEAGIEAEIECWLQV
jgi:hypothetical protein